MPSSGLPVPNPKWSNFDEIFKIDIYQLIKATNTHSCTKTCFKYAKANQKNPECRSKFPRKLILKSNIDPTTGNIELKRTDQYINNYNPFLSAAARCNFFLLRLKIYEIKSFFILFR